MSTFSKALQEDTVVSGGPAPTFWKNLRLSRGKAPDGPLPIFALSRELVHGLVVHELVHALDGLCVD